MRWTSGRVESPAAGTQRRCGHRDRTQSGWDTAAKGESFVRAHRGELTRPGRVLHRPARHRAVSRLKDEPFGGAGGRAVQAAKRFEKRWFAVLHRLRLSRLS